MTGCGVHINVVHNKCETNLKYENVFMCELGYGKPRFYLEPKPNYALRIFDTQISYDILGKMTLF